MGIQAFRLFNVPVYLHWSAIILVLILWSLGPIAVAGIILSILAHEFAHILVGRRYGVESHQVTVFGLGMAVTMDSVEKGESVISIAGPLMNFLIASLIFLSQMWFPVLAAFEPLLTIAIANVILGVFNLAPIYPLDGGRVLRGILTHWMNRLKATKVVAIVGTVFAVAGLPFAVMKGNPFLFVILLGAIYLSWLEVKLLKEGRLPSSMH